jgi:general secretion pathway protein L
MASSALFRCGQPAWLDPDLLNRLGRWWLSEFLALFPERMAQWIIGRNQKSLSLAAQPEMVVLRLLGGNQEELASQSWSRGEYSAACIDTFLQEQGLERSRVAIGIRLPARDFFERKLTLPIETLHSLDEVLARDLALKTPFRLSDIYQGYMADRTRVAGKIIVWQRLIRRELVEEAVRQLGIELGELAFIGAADMNDSPHVPLITLRQEHAGRRPWVRKAAFALGLTTVILGVLAGGVKYWHQQAIMDRLTAQVAIARSIAQKVRSEFDKAEQKQAVLVRLRLRKSHTRPLIEVWEETTRVLPNHSWLIELALSDDAAKREQHLALTGFSAAAANLVTLLDESPLFADARLTAPIAIDPIEGKERFALQAKIKPRDQIK